MTVWTPAEDKMMLDLREAGLTQEDIGLKLGRSRTAVERRLKRINAPHVRRDWTDEELEEFKLLYVGGASMKQICMKLRRSPLAVRHARAKVGIVRPLEAKKKIARECMGKVADRYWTQERDDQLIWLWQKGGKTKKDTAKSIGCGVNAVSGRIRRLGLKRDAGMGEANARSAALRAWSPERKQYHAEKRERRRLEREPPLSAAEFKRLSDRAKEEARVKVMLSRMFNGPRTEGAVYRPKFL